MFVHAFWAFTKHHSPQTHAPYGVLASSDASSCQGSTCTGVGNITSKSKDEIEVSMMQLSLKQWDNSLVSKIEQK